ncbi:MAG: hypothetical protein BGO78_09935 [Chloroflexi bacterium 44-23]|nr:MAG: hypothetical protein BGO78_09935 [Chloroflexi bacterium 44-23]
MKIRLLTYHFIRNNGAALYCYSLYHALKRVFPQADIKFIDYRPLNMHLVEELKVFKPLPGEPFFYWYRNRVFNHFVRDHLPLTQPYSLLLSPKQFFKKLKKSDIDCLIVGMDVWCLTKGLERTSFPSAYWLQTAPYYQAAYAVSAYKTEMALLDRYEAGISARLGNFQLIYTRDEFTQNLVNTLNHNPAVQVKKVPDPTFLLDVAVNGLKEKLEKMGVDFSKPLVGVLLHGHEEIMLSIYKHFHSAGYQVIALSMYNHHADLNLGHLLDPLEWAATFAFFQFCVTNRFHGTILCLKNKIPFLALLSEQLDAPINCKIRDLLESFNLLDCYQDTTSASFNLEGMLKAIKRVQSLWNSHYLQQVNNGLIEMRTQSEVAIHFFKK